jgi:hypothetical protein
LALAKSFQPDWPIQNNLAPKHSARDRTQADCFCST